VVSLNSEQTCVVLVRALQFLAEKAPFLNELDRALGDGDHGTTLARGVKSALRDLESIKPRNVNEVFVVVGKGMIKSMGGASGILYGVFFRGAQDAPETMYLNSRSLREILNSGFESLKLKTKAEVGDKTMIDALVPALQALERVTTDSVSEALEAAASAAAEGAQATIGRLPKFGRAKTLGERALAAQDAGAASIALLFRGLADATAEMSREQTRDQE
jgi:phosphoenolpyruvate---glycerone phosphotransferase subunit DhaL